MPNSLARPSALALTTALALAACGGSLNEQSPDEAGLSPPAHVALASSPASPAPRGCGEEPRRCDMAEASPPAQPEGY